MDIYIIGGLIILLGLFLRSYTQEKGKLKALKSENKSLVDETEKIKSQYSKELEELKKDHQLDITKRKYLYESKREQYVSFFQLLDQFTKENSSKAQEKMIPIVENFLNDFLIAQNQEEQFKAVTAMSTEMQKITFEASQDLIKIKQQTNTIRLIADQKIIEKLDILNLAFDKSIEDSNKTLSDLPALIINNDQIKIQENQKMLENSGMYVKKNSDELIALMREDLNKI